MGYPDALTVIAALGAVATAIFTGTLWWSTRELWKASERQIKLVEEAAKQQWRLERPYVYAVPTTSTLRDFIGGKSSKPEIVLNIKNAGRGPARIKLVMLEMGIAKTYGEAAHEQYSVHGAETYVLAGGEGFTTSPIDVTNSVGNGRVIPEAFARNMQLVFVTPHVIYLDADGNEHTATESWRLYSQGAGLDLRREDTGAQRFT